MLKKGKTKKRWNRMFAAMLTLVLVLALLPSSVLATDSQEDNFLSTQSETSTEIMPSAVDNLVSSLRPWSSLTVTSDGYMRVCYDGEQIGVEYYDNSFNIISKTTIAMELNVWGGFYAGADAYYIVEGQYNTDEDDDAEVIRVIKYSTEWERLGAASITSNPNLFGGEVGYPFYYGCVQFTEYNGTLYIVTGHAGYVDESIGQGHQGFLMIAVDESEMTGQIVKSNLWHSFAQYIDNDGSDLYVLEQSEGSRCTALSKIDADTLDTTEISILDYGGSHTSARAISCYASVDGMALSSDNVICVGTSIDQSLYDSVTSDTAHNIYLTVTPKSNFTQEATSIIWLTDFSGDGKCFVGLNITKVNDNRFMVSWEEYTEEIEDAADSGDALSGYKLHYIFVDGDGNKISSEFTAAAPISECQSVLSGSNIVYFASSSNMVDFYTINAFSGEFSKKIYRVAGENATWNIKNGVLTVYGEGAVSVDTDIFYRYPLSSCKSWYSYSNTDNAWKPVGNYVEKMLIRNGITEISEGTFKGFSSLMEVNIQSGIKSIGDEAFSYCTALRKITIPSSVISIGDDILWTGLYWTTSDAHAVFAIIYCESGSAAESYAISNGIYYVAFSAGSGLGSNADTLCVRRGNWFYVNYTLKGGDADMYFTYGREADEVLIGDWDGDGIDTICVRRGNRFYFSNTLGGQADFYVDFGRTLDEVVVGDWDGDGCDTICVRRGNHYYINNTLISGNAAIDFTFGMLNDEVLAGDWDGDGCDTLCIRRGNTYYINNTLEGGNAAIDFTFGKTTDSVLSGDWDGDGCDTLCIRRGNHYYINNVLEGGNAVIDFTFGRDEDEVYAGTWK